LGFPLARFVRRQNLRTQEKDMRQPERRRSSVLTMAGRLGAASATAVVLSLSSVAAVDAGASSGHGAKISVVKTSSFGEVLADGKTVYTLRPSATPCTAQCLKVWPAVVLPHGTVHPTAGSGVRASKLGTRHVRGVGLQVTYNGKLLYWFIGDTAPGQVHGAITDRWGKWSPVVLSSAGTVATTPTTGASNAGSGGIGF
jgi:predicted lipoprotein with Yx(FWY)xxD motif